MRCPTLSELPPPPAGKENNESIRTQRCEWVALVGILLLALGLRVWGIEFGLPQRYHIDEPPYVLAALRIANGDFYIFYPYNSPNIFEFMLTGLYSVWYILGSITGAFDSPATFAALYQSDPSGFYLLARGLSVVISTGTVALVYLLGRRLNDGLTGLIAAGFLAIAFSHARDAHYAVTDTLVTGMVVASLLGTVLYAQSGRRCYLVLAGLAGGAAIGLKYLPAVILIPALLSLMWKGRWKKDLLILLASSAFGYILAFPALILDFDLFLQQWSQVWNQATSPLGGIQVNAVPSFVYYVKTFVWGLGLPMTIMAALGLILWLARRQPVAYVYVLAFGMGYFAGINVVGTAFVRYALPLVPVLVLLAAFGVVTILRWFDKRTSKRLAIVMGGMLGISVCVVPLTSLVRHDLLLTRVDTRTLARNWIEQHVPEGTRIAIQWYGPALSTSGDLEPGTTRVYDLVEITPFETRSEWYRLETYRTVGVSYVVVNSWGKGFVHIDREQHQLRQAFFEDLEIEAQLVARFDPLIEDRQAPFIFEQIYGPYTSLWEVKRPGPTIEIYRLSF